MRDFLSLLKKTYVLCAAIAIFLALGVGPVALAITNESIWWSALEILTAPAGIAVATFVLTKIDDM